MMNLATHLYANEGDEICFTQDQAANMAVELKDGRLNAEIVVKQEQIIKEKDGQIVTLEEKVKVLDDQGDAMIKQIELNKKLAKDKDDARLAEIKDLKKPRWGSLFGSFGIGAATIGILLLLL